MHTVSHTDARLVGSSPSITAAAQRRRRHLSVYHRALRSAETADQRAAVAARYRHLFALDAPQAATVSADVQMLDLARVSDAELAERARRANRAVARAAVDDDADRECRGGVVASTGSAGDLDRECRGGVVAPVASGADLDRECREVTVTVAA